MSRARKPWFRKSNKRWYVEFDGKQVNLGPDKKEALRQFHDLMAKPELDRTTVRSLSISLPEIVDHFLDWVHRNRVHWYLHIFGDLVESSGWN
ncbi:MAG: hypothetical protein R3C01_09675 [Planctomycetaceae bacterium]